MNDTPNQANYRVTFMMKSSNCSHLLYETRQQAERGYKVATTRWRNGRYPNVVSIDLYRESDQEVLASTRKEAQ
jgi:hypothetical protein